MKTNRSCFSPSSGTFAFQGAAAWGIVLCACAWPLQAQDSRGIDGGFTEPNQSVRLAAAEAGTIDAFMVREGSHVKRGEVICKLDTQVLDAALAIAKVKLESRGRISSAEATLRHRQNHLKQLEELKSQSHASEQEVTDARLNVALASAALQSAMDDQAVARAEVQHIEAQIQRRIVRSSIDGIVLELPKQAGEAINAAENHVATIVQLDRLKVRLFLSCAQAHAIHEGSQCQLRFMDNQRVVQATVGFVAPVVDSNSGTVRVELWIDNRLGDVRSGVACVLQNSPQPSAAITGPLLNSANPSPTHQLPTSISRPVLLKGDQ